jgi:hypothetical protein
MTEQLRIAINKLYTTQETKDLLISQCDLIDEEHTINLKEIKLLNELVEMYKSTVRGMHIDNLHETEAETLHRHGDGGDDEGFNEFVNRENQKQQ